MVLRAKQTSSSLSPGRTFGSQVAATYLPVSRSCFQLLRVLFLALESDGPVIQVVPMESKQAESFPQPCLSCREIAFIWPRRVSCAITHDLYVESRWALQPYKLKDLKLKTLVYRQTLNTLVKVSLRANAADGHKVCTVKNVLNVLIHTRCSLSRVQIPNIDHGLKSLDRKF